jgi:hypothetical protein
LFTSLELIIYAKEKSSQTVHFITDDIGKAYGNATTTANVTAPVITLDPQMTQMNAAALSIARGYGIRGNQKCTYAI